jgi:sodium/potassium-transporting ATPase subunit alpha
VTLFDFHSHPWFPVNERSILSLKKRALRRTKTLARDPETQEALRPNVFTRFIMKLKTPFTRIFWEDKFESTDNETLVDNKLLSYSYLEAGLIETFSA